jgi:predicted ATPase
MNWTLEERNKFANLYVKNIIDSEIVSLIIFGDPGMGKTPLVTTMLEEAGYARNQPESKFVKAKKEYRHASGHSSAMGLYSTLHAHRFNTSVIVFDDCDSIFSDKISTNILKAVLNTDPDKREVSWSSESNSMTLPKRFKFEGRVVFITNLKPEKIDRAVMDRTRSISLHMDIDEKTETMAQIVNNPQFMPEIDIATKLDAFNLVNTYKHGADEFSIRKLKSVIIDYNTASKNGIDPVKAVLYSLNGKRDLSVRSVVTNTVPMEKIETAIREDNLFQF